MDTSGSFAGLSWGPTTPYHLTEFTGLDSIPSIRHHNSPRANAHGALLGKDLHEVRVFTLKFEIVPPTAAQFDGLVDAFEAAFVVTPDYELPLLFRGSTRLVKCRPQNRAVLRPVERFQRSAEGWVEFIAVDPHIYDATLTQVVSGLAIGGAGIAVPIAVPIVYGAGSSAGGIVGLTNIGSMPARPLVTIQGPVDNPVIESMTESKALAFSLSLSASDVLTVDLDARTVLLNGTASRRSTLTAAQWWDLLPGTNQVRFRNAGGFQPAATASLSFRSAWM